MADGITLNGQGSYDVGRYSHLDHELLVEKGFPKCMIPCLEQFYEDAHTPIKKEVEDFIEEPKEASFQGKISPD